MAKRLLSLTLSFISSLAVDTASAQQPGPAANAPAFIPKPDQTPSPPNPGVRQIPPPKAPAPVAPTTAAPAMPSARAPAVTPLGSPSNSRPSVQRFADGLAILLLNLGAYNDPTPDQKNRIVIALNSLKAVAYDVQPLLTANSTDPVMRYISFDLAKQFLRMEAAINAGTYSYARYLLRQTAQYTVPYQPGMKSNGLLQFPEPPPNLSDLEKAEYFAAIKRYEESMLAYERVLSDKQFRQTRPEIWEKAIENLMAITIRVRSDAHITLEMSSALLEESTYSPNQKVGGPVLLSKAQQIIERGNQLSKQGTSFGTIEYLRAMSLLDALALSGESDSLKAKGFQLTGKTSEKLRHVFLWMHPDAYYEACIRAKPHSTDSRECIKLMETFQTQQKDVVADRDKLKALTELAR